MILPLFLKIRLKPIWYGICIGIFSNFAALEILIRFLGVAR